MSTDKQKQKIVKQRQRWATEMVLEDARMRDNMTDEEAKPFLDWALAQVEQTVLQTADMSESEAEQLIEERVTAVCQNIQTVNQQVPKLASLSKTKAASQIGTFLSQLQSSTKKDRQDEEE